RPAAAGPVARAQPHGRRAGSGSSCCVRDRAVRAACPRPRLDLPRSEHPIATDRDTVRTMSAVQNIAVPPHNLEAEKSVLGAVLLDERHLYALLVEEHLRPEHFYREQHGAIFAAMLELHNTDRKID